MPRRTTSYLLNGKASKSIRVHNRQMSARLPSSNSAFCQSVYDFIKLLIGNELTGLVPDDQLATADALEKEKLQDRSCFRNFNTSSYKPETAGKKKSILTKYHSIFLEDLKQLNLKHSHFNYSQNASSRWNALFIDLLCKHWTYAESQNAFSAYPMDLNDVDPPKLHGVITRWFNGKKVLFSQKKPLDPKENNMRRRNWCTRRALAKRRVVALKSLGISPECCKPFEEPNCHSDSEELDDGTVLKVKLPWRSPVVAALCEVADKMTIQATCPGKIDHRLYEVRRRPARRANNRAMVPMNLPADAYNTDFIKSLLEPEQNHLSQKPPCGLAEFYCKITREHPKLFHSIVLSHSL